MSEFVSMTLNRRSLIEEAAEVLRKAIAGSRWTEHLPSERRLAVELGISRPTLRAALELLNRDGLIVSAQGRRTRLRMPSSSTQSPVKGVALLSPVPVHEMPPFVLLWIDQLRSQLARRHLLLHVQVGRAEFARRLPDNALRSLTSGSPGTTWILYQSTEPMQRWFATHRVPCVVVGSTHPGIDLPAVDRDYRSVCRHAVGLLAGRGYRNLGLLIQRPQFGGDKESIDGFHSGLSDGTRRRVSGHVWLHDGSPQGICDALNTALASKPLPDALIVARTAFALTALTHLLQRGIRIPEDMALVCRDDDTYLDDLIPPIARYAVDPAQFAKRIFKLIECSSIRQTIRVVPSLVLRESM